MSDLLKHQQALHENNAKWNKVINKIKERVIGENFELLDEVDYIIKKEFVLKSTLARIKKAEKRDD